MQVDMHKEVRSNRSVHDFDTAFKQEDKYLTMLGLDIYPVNFASQNKRPRDQIPSPRSPVYQRGASHSTIAS